MLPLRNRLLYAAPVGLLIVGILAFSILSLVNTISPRGIIIHHSAVPPFHDGRQIDAKVIDEIHRDRGYKTFYWGRFYHIGYHYVILPDGTVQEGRPEHCIGSHAAGYNSYIGICVVGDFSSRDNPKGERGLTVPTDAQMQALTDLCQRLKKRYGFPIDNTRKHSNVNSSTECPGDRFPFERLITALK